LEEFVQVQLKVDSAEKHRVVTLDNDRQFSQQESCLANITKAALGCRPNSPRKSNT